MRILTNDELEQIRISEIAKLLFAKFKQIGNDKLNIQNTIDEFIDRNTRPDIRESFQRQYMEAFTILQRRGLIMQAWGVQIGHWFTLTSVGEKSDLDDEILILDDAEEKVKSIYKEVPNFDEKVADFYRESIKAWQEDLLLSSCICLGAASECAIHLLAEALAVYDSSHKSSIENKWVRKNMKNKIDTLWNWIHQIEKKDFPNAPCFKDLRSKLDQLAHWYRITRNEAGHADREAILPTKEEIELSVHQFRRYIIILFQIIDKFKSKNI